MGDRSSIEWTDATWNPTTGCDRVSPGCDNCYALTLSARLKAMGLQKYERDGDPRTSGPGFGLSVHREALFIPLHWRTPRRVFTNSMSDLWHPGVSDSFIATVFAVMAATPRHSYQVLTKRPQRMARLLAEPAFIDAVRQAALVDLGLQSSRAEHAWPLPNVWLGTSIESDEYIWRARHVLESPATVRFLSLEPLLGPIASLDVRGFDWIIVGGESGRGARPLDSEWVKHIRDQCEEAGIPFFFKQWGGRTSKSNGRELDGRTWDELPSITTG